MAFQSDIEEIRWRLHLASSRAAVFDMLATDAGRASFWAESAVEREGAIDFVFPDGQMWRGEILEVERPHLFSIVYFGGSVTTFRLEDDGRGGTDLLLEDAGVSPDDRTEVVAGWVSVLLALKATVDFGIDLRNHDPTRTWADGYVDN